MFPGQGLNACPSSKQSHSSDSAGSLTCHQGTPFCPFFLRATLEAYGGSQARGQIRAAATATATQDPSHVCDLTTAHGDAGSLTHWARPGINPANSWVLVRFLTRWATMGTPGSCVFIHSVILSSVAAVGCTVPVAWGNSQARDWVLPQQRPEP